MRFATLILLLVACDGTTAPTDASTTDAGASDAGFDAGVVEGAPTFGSGGELGEPFGTCADGREYRLHVPAGYDETVPTPLVVALHGNSGTFSGFFTSLRSPGFMAVADTEGFLLLSPQHENPTRPSFLHTTAMGGVDIDATTAELEDLLACLYDDVGALYNIQTTRIYLIGFSEGGSVTDMAAAAMSDAFHAVAIYAGALPGKGSLLPAPRRIPVRMLVGSLDTGFLIPARESRDEWMTAGHLVMLDEVDGAGHSVPELEAGGPGFSTVFAWMRDADVEPAPSRYGR